MASDDARSVLNTATDTNIENWAKADTESKKGSIFVQKNFQKELKQLSSADSGIRSEGKRYIIYIID